MAEQGSMFGEPIVWRDTIRSPRLLVFDARLIFFCALIVFHLRIWTVVALLVGVMVFWLIERAGLRFPSALRALRSRLAGATRPAMPRSLYRSAITTAFEGHPLLPAQRHRVAAPTKVKREKPKKSRKLKNAPSPADGSLSPAK